jgi:hypothetical protein
VIPVLICIVVGIIFALILSMSERRIYQQLIVSLECERDAARDEAQAFRGILIPKLAKVEGAAGEPRAAAIPPELPLQRTAFSAASPIPAKPVNPLLNKRIPFRLRFKMAAKANNMKQKQTDALASALAQIKPAQEKSNA